MDIPAILSRLERVARDLSLPFGRRTMTYNSRRAQELGKWAETQAMGEKFHHAVFLAYFRDGKNIGRIDVLQKVCLAIGLDPEAAQKVLDGRSFAAAVDADWDRSRRMGIRAVPTFVLGDNRLVGAQSYAALERLVDGGGASRRR